MQFREIEFSSGLKDSSILHSFRADEFAATRLQARHDAPTLSDAFYALLRRRGFDAPDSEGELPEEERRKRYGQRARAVLEILTHFEDRVEEFQLIESLIEHDD